MIQERESLKASYLRQNSQGWFLTFLLLSTIPVLKHRAVFVLRSVKPDETEVDITGGAFISSWVEEASFTIPDGIS